MFFGVVAVGACVGAANAAARTWQGLPLVVALLGAWFLLLRSTQSGGITDAESELLGLTMACGMVGFGMGGSILPFAARRMRRRRPPRAQPSSG